MPRAALLLLQAAAIVNALSRADVTQLEAESLCGDLGVMEVPEGIDPSTVRVCREHPDGISSPEVESSADVLQKRKCWRGRAVGCSKKGWCYRSCDNGGNGAWCWTTKGSPYGDWKGCRSHGDCSRDDPCSGGGCKDCGCGC